MTLPRSVGESSSSAGQYFAEDLVVSHQKLTVGARADPSEVETHRRASEQLSVPRSSRVASRSNNGVCRRSEMGQENP